MFSNASNITGTSLDIFLENFIQKLTNMEYAIPLENTLACLEELQFYFKNKANILHGPLEIRPAKGDSYYLSPTINQPVAYFGFVIYHPYGKKIDYPAHFKPIETILLKHGGRPHWGKFFSLNHQQLIDLFPDLPKFIEIKNKVDPDGIFNNQFIDTLLINQSL